jgi:glycosyltransferase involved in cell wall biosynthesis
MSLSIEVNTRFLEHKLTGVQRYTTEILNRFGDRIEVYAPEQWSSSGILGHIWEQFVLPFQLDGRLFWNPTCPGPVAVSNQVVTVHDLTAIEHPEWFDRKYALWNRVLTPLVLSRCRHIIAVSNYTKESIKHQYGISEKKITVIPNGVDSRFSPTEEAAIEKARSELGIPDGPYVLSLSALEPRKNLERLLQVWGCIKKSIESPPTLVLAGGAGRPTIFHNFSLGSPPQNVHFTGYVEDDLLPALYAGAEIFVYPSLYEGFGLPVLEAMACETPVVTSNRTSLPEVAGDAAHLVNPYRTESIAEGINRVLEDSDYRTELRRKGRERAKSFTWERTATETLNVLERVQSA